MSFCSKCGAQIESANQQFCPNCGEKNQVQPTVSNDTPVINPAPTPIINQPVFGNNPYINQAAQPAFKHPMKWFKFLIYFALIFGAIINFIFGMNYITGGIYFVQTNGQVSAETVYGTFGTGLKVLDIIYGFLLIAISAFGIYTECRLAKYKSNGPLCITILYAVAAGLTIFYDIALLAVTGLNQLTSGTNIFSIVFSVGFVLINYNYFKKRKELFVK
ncbi:MAG: zinc ribbon domain-containing protein [Clostridia bacterium]|nr:zinc ribbon domain-containing protein [Clostridia bacterium]